MNASDSRGTDEDEGWSTKPLPFTAHESPRIERLKSIAPKPGEASFFYRDPYFEQDSVKVLPGEYYVTQEDVMLATVLGSCIATCIWDPNARVGGMNHFMLPGDGDSSTSGRFGAHAMALLINEMLKLGARREGMQAKVFGGGQVIHGFTTLNVGEHNAQFAIDYLQTERIAVVSKDVLDIYPRKVCYFPTSGKALVKRLAHAHPETQETHESRSAAAALSKTRAGGPTDIFSGYAAHRR